MGFKVLGFGWHERGHPFRALLWGWVPQDLKVFMVEAELTARTLAASYADVVRGGDVGPTQTSQGAGIEWPGGSAGAKRGHAVEVLWGGPESVPLRTR